MLLLYEDNLLKYQIVCVCVHRRLTKWSEKRTSNRPTLRNS